MSGVNKNGLKCCFFNSSCADFKKQDKSQQNCKIITEKLPEKFLVARQNLLVLTGVFAFKTETDKKGFQNMKSQVPFGFQRRKLTPEKTKLYAMRRDLIILKV